MIVRWPGVTNAGTENDTPVISMDLTATILDAAGVAVAENEQLDGESLRPLFTGGKLAREALYFHYPHFAFHKANRPGSAIRSDRHKLIHYYDDNSAELYDLKNDLGEQHDLAEAKPAVARKLREQLTRWLEDTKAGLPKSTE